jgi:hypothetical protein
MCYGRGLLSTQVGHSVHPPNQQGQAQVSYKSQLHGQARHTHTHTMIAGNTIAGNTIAGNTVVGSTDTLVAGNTGHTCSCSKVRRRPTEMLDGWMMHD